MPEMPLLIHESLSQRQIQTDQLKHLNHELIQIRKDMQQFHKRLMLILVASVIAAGFGIALL
jgi:hypothetical protein